MFDPPNGWMYGFPKPIPAEYLKSQTLLKMWLLGEGYSSEWIELAMKHYQCWEVEEKE